MDEFKPYPFFRALIVTALSGLIVFTLDAIASEKIDWIPALAYALGMLGGWWLFSKGVRP